MEGQWGEFGYTYIHEGEYYSGVHRTAFMLRSSAEEWVARISVGSQITVRVNPTQPETSVVAVDSEIAS
jgi:hypothetical protein